MRAVVDALRMAGATTPDRAMTLEALGIRAEQSETRELIRDGVLLPGQSANSWYLSEKGYIAHRDARARRARTALLIVLFIVLALVVLGVTIGRR
ncbi:MAG: hypothetical protein JWL95_1939 [Gemmatimonadetes bacterium]|nr:hypothetical protein [Gemmatimonadota bacterium]